MSRDLFKLFGEAARGPRDSAATAPQSLTDIAADPGEQDAIVRQASRALEAQLRVDYSSFSNHVFLNSALSYFNLTGERILSEYPIGGSRGEIEAFIDDLDGYQRHTLESWPERSGHLMFRPSVSASYVQVDDVGNEDGVTKTALLNPGTGSWSVELWYNSARTLTGSQDTSFLIQKSNAAGTTVSMYLSASSVFFQVLSGAASTQVSAPAHIGSNGYVLGVVDRAASATGTLLIYTGSLTSFPRLVSSSSISFGGQVGTASGSLFIGSGTLSGKSHVPYSGTVDEVRVWRTPLDRAEVSSSFNRKVYARGSLMGIWRFNETGSSGLPGLDSVVIDSSGHSLNGRVRNYWSGVRGSGSLVYEVPDPIIDVNCREVLDFIEEQQASGSDYDRNNPGKITDMFPQALLEGQEEQDQDIVRNFLYVMARHFDRIKLYADHLQYSLRVNESEFNQAPDAMLEEVASFFGWELPGGFSDAGALQYLIGRDVRGGELSNDELDRKLHDIKTAIWRRLLSNLARIYKTKGTRESVRSILNSHGIPSNIFRIKEYGYSSRSALTTERIASERSSYALTLGSGTLTGSVRYSALSSSLEMAPSTSLNTSASSSLIQFEQMAQPFPSGSTEFFTLTGARPKHIWLMQETGGDGILDSITGERLGKPTASPYLMCGATASGFWYNGSFTGKKCLEFSGRAFGQEFSASLSSVCNPTTESFFGMAVVRMPATGALLQGPFGKYDNTNDIGWECLYNDSCRLAVTIRDSPAGFGASNTSSSMHADFAWHVIGYGLSRTSGTILTITDHEVVSTSAAGVTGSVSSAALIRLNASRTPSFSGGTKSQMAYFAFFTGSDAEVMMAHGGNVVRKNFWKHASASFGTYERIGDTICTQVGLDGNNPIMAMYGSLRPGRNFVKQVPYVYETLFSGSQSVGILCLPSYVNYLQHSYNFTEWTAASATVSPGPTSAALPLNSWALSPWRTRTSSVVTGSGGVGSYIETTTIGPMTGSQEYCASVYVSAETDGGEHPATLEVIDVNSGIALNSGETDVGFGGFAWSRIGVAFAMPPLSSSVKIRFYPNQAATGTVHVAIDGAQVNEGPQALPLITNSKNGSPNADYGAIWSNIPAMTGTHIAVDIGPNQVPLSAGRIDVLYDTDIAYISSSFLGRLFPTEQPRVLVEAGGHSATEARKLFVNSGSRRFAGALRDSTTYREFQMSANTTVGFGRRTAILTWNQTHPSHPNVTVENDGTKTSFSQSFTPGSNYSSKLFIGHASATLDTSGSSHFCGWINRITMYSSSIHTSYLTSSIEHGIGVRDFSVETRVMWPTSGNTSMSGTEASGSLWFIKFRDEDSSNHHMTWKRTSADGKTGSLILRIGSASLTASSLPIFDDRWYNIYAMRGTVSGAYTVRVSRFDDGDIVYNTSSLFAAASMPATSYRQTGSITAIYAGTSGNLRSQQWMDEFRIWNRVLSDEEMDDHCLHYRSFGNESVFDARDLELHWRLDDGTAATAAGNVSVLDHSLNERHGTGSFWQQGVIPFRKFLNGYSYIGSPDFGWSENKTRVFSGNSLSREDTPETPDSSPWR